MQTVSIINIKECKKRQDRFEDLYGAPLEVQELEFGKFARELMFKGDLSVTALEFAAKDMGWFK